jgi:cell division protein FtsW (lipid II flippase)
MTEHPPAREAIRVLPDSHTDFLFSVDRGAVALGLALMALLSFIVIRTLLRTRRGAGHDR